MIERYRELAKHAAAVLEPDDWETLTGLALKLTKGVSLDDSEAVALALERAILFLVFFNTRIGAPAMAELH